MKLYKHRIAIFGALCILLPIRAIGQDIEDVQSLNPECYSEDGTSNEATLFCSGVDLIPPAFFERAGITSESQKQAAQSEEKKQPEESGGLPEISDAPIETNPTAYIAEDWLWRAENSSARDVDGILEIPVCWINPVNSDVDRAGRELSKLAIETTWNSHGLVKFDGWTKCIEGQTGGVRIHISDVRPVAHVGRSADTKTVGMRLNFTFNSSGFEECKNVFGVVSNISGKTNWANCVYSIAVHEFGHTLGYLHEHDRIFYNIDIASLSTEDFSKYKGFCSARNVSIANATVPNQINIITTSYDPISVMNYCYEIYDHRASLSVTDIKGFKKAYGDD